jgi:phosphatidylglycerol:prolipoprotein diacylglycerol transferase
VYSRFPFTDWVTPFGLVFIAAILAAWFLARRNAKSTYIDPSHIDLIVPITIIVGIAGGTVLSSLPSIDQTVAGDAMNQGPRLRLIGFLGSGAIGLFIYSRLVRLSFRRLLDVFALPTLTGLMIHRVGCYLAGCCWGDVIGSGHAGDLTVQVRTTSFLEGIVRGVQYPPGSLPYEQHMTLGLIEPGALASLPVYPVQLYEAALLAMLVLFLSRVQWRRVPRGTLAILAVVAYAVMRFFIEYLRADGPVVLGNLTVTQLQCIILACSVVLLPRFRGRVVS